MCYFYRSLRQIKKNNYGNKPLAVADKKNYKRFAKLKMVAMSLEALPLPIKPEKTTKACWMFLGSRKIHAVI